MGNITVSNNLDPDQARQNVGPDLCLQRISHKLSLAEKRVNLHISKKWAFFVIDPVRHSDDLLHHKIFMKIEENYP